MIYKISKLQNNYNLDIDIIEINEINDVSNSDMKMNYCVTPRRIYQF